MKIELSKEELIIAITAVRQRAESLHNLADGFNNLGLAAVYAYREAGNICSKLHDKLTKEYLSG